MWKEMKKRVIQRGIVLWLLVCWGVVPHFFSSLYFILGDVFSSSFFLCNEVKWLVGGREGRRSKIRRDDRSWGYRLCSHSIGSCVFAVCHCYCFETIPHSHCPGQVYIFLQSNSLRIFLFVAILVMQAVVARGSSSQYHFRIFSRN
jgi:hypothetical protein